MSLRTLAWKFASPYDAYVSHVARLNAALRRIDELSRVALAYEAGLQSSVRLIPPVDGDDEDRVLQFRGRLAQAAGEMSDEAFEDFARQLGGGHKATVEGDRARTASRLSGMSQGIAEHFATAATELAILESRGYTPTRPDVARQLSDNNLPSTTVAGYRSRLRELGVRIGRTVA